VRTLKLIWFLTIAASFFGPTLALPGYQSIFAYRILFLIHGALFFFYWVRKRGKLPLGLHIKEYVWFYLFWFGWAVFSLLWADSRTDAFRHIWFLFSGSSLILFSVIHLKKEQDLQRLYFLLITILFLFLGVSLWEHFYRYNVGVGGSALFFERGIPNAFMGNPNDLATFLALYLPFFFCLARYGEKPVLRIIGLVGIPITLHIILLTRSRANLLAVGIMVFTAFWFFKPWKIVQRHKLASLALVLAVVLIITGLYNFSQSFWYFLAKEKQMLLTQFGSLEDSSSIDIRLTLLYLGMVLLKNHFFLGVGAGNVEFHMAPFKEMTQGIINMHNWWGEVLVNYGILVWVGYLIFFAKMVWDLLMVHKYSPRGILKMTAETLLISLSGFVLAVTSSSTMAASRYMWLLLALVFTVINIHRNRKKEDG